MARKRIAVIGAGNMARVRGHAFLATGRAEICAVAARRTELAQACAKELDCNTYFDDYRRVASLKPDALLLELPHQPQEEVTLWALDQRFDLLIGGCLAAKPETGEAILTLSDGLIVEVGYQRRYDPAWEEMRRLVLSGDLGDPVMGVCMALWQPDPASWYFDQALSGGMPLTHMSYCYVNALRWILGQPASVCAIANRLSARAPGHVTEESCGALIQFESGAFLSATASYIGPPGMQDARTRLICTGGGITVNGEGSLAVTRDQKNETLTFATHPGPQFRQAEHFLESLDSRAPCRNPPADALVDLRLAVAISSAAAQQRPISLWE